jgi:two-component system LytT family response regulator
MPPIIFVTAHDKYAIRAFEIAVIDYLLRPVTEERFALAFKRAIDRLRGAPCEDATKQLMAMLDAIASRPRQLERFAVRSGENTCFVSVNDVGWIEAFQNYVRRIAPRRSDEAKMRGLCTACFEDNHVIRAFDNVRRSREGSRWA